MIFNNGHLELRFAAESGALEQIVFEGRELMASWHDGELFNLNLRDRNGVACPVNNRLFAPPEFKLTETADGQNLCLDFGSCRQMANLTVTVNVRLDHHTPMSYWRIAVNHIAPDYYLEWIDFPRVRVNNDLKGKGGSSQIFWPGCEGVLFDDLETREETGFFKGDLLTYPLNGVSGYYPGTCPMQFQAYFKDGSGLYFAAHDQTHAPKGVEVVLDEHDTVRMFYQLFTGSDSVASCELPYEMVLGAFHGDWQDAAIIYRDWLEKSDPAMPPRLKDNADVPEWLKESPLILIYPVKGDGFDTGSITGNEYFPYINAMPMVEEYTKKWKCRIMCLLMHWEGTAPWAPPYVWPPYGGTELFREFADALHKSGHLLGVYCSGIGWTQTSSLDTSYTRTEQFAKEQLQKEMCTGPQQEMFAKVCNGEPGKGQRIGYEMCVSRPFTVQTITAEMKKIVSSGVDYIQYFDQNQGCSAPLCYNKEHGHPSAPGAWLTDGMRELLAQSIKTIREAGSDAILGCENAAAQPYIKYLQLNDLRNHLAWCFAQPVPAYGMLFHEYINNFMGNGVCLAWWFDRQKCPEFIHYRTTYAFISGEIISAVLKDKGEMHWSWVLKWHEAGPDQDSLATLIGNLNDLRRNEARNYLVFGRMEKNIPVICRTWRLYFQNHHKPLDLPAVLSSTWSFEGKKGQILANFRNQPESVTVNFPAVTEGVCYDGTTRQAFKTRVLELTVPPLSAVLIELPLA